MKNNWNFAHDNECDTGVLPPGDDVMPGQSLPNKGQSLNRGFGATQADLVRGHASPPQPPVYERPNPQRRRSYDDEKGFVDRPIGSTERN